MWVPLMFVACCFIVAHATDSASCLSIGFNDKILQCSTCSKLEHAVFASDLPVITENCKKCCTQDQKYDVAVIEVDKRFVKQFYPEVHGVLVDQSLKGLVNSRNVQNARPSLILYYSNSGQNGSKRKSTLREKEDVDDMVIGETINIGSWKKDAIREYLQMNIK